MLSFREYVGAVGDSLKTITARQFKKSFPELLNEHMLLKLDKFYISKLPLFWIKK